MSLSYLTSQLEELRAQAERNQIAYGRELKEVGADSNLSAQGKKEKSNELYASYKAANEGLRDREKALVASERATLEARINITSGSSSSDIISFRDAQDRADAITNADEAARIMARAISSKDTTLAAAIFRRATTDTFFGASQWSEARRLYTDANPSARDAARDLDSIQQYENAGFNRAMAYGIFRP